MHRFAYAGVDMKVLHHIDAIEGSLWWRPSEVTLHAGSLHCTLRPERRYDFEDAYKRSPHRQFLNARTDEEMRVFVKAWGPLYLSPDEQSAGIAVQPLSEYQARRKWLAAFVGLMTAIQNARMERESLEEFVLAETEKERLSPIHDPNAEAFFLVLVRAEFRVQGAFSEWTKQAPLPEIRAAARSVLETYSIVMPLHLKVARHKKGFNLKARWLLDDLETALRWMVWYDVFRADPVLCCEECRKFFKPDSAHKHKFCSPECARRVAARNWRRKDLAKKRLAKEKIQERSNKNVTNQTR